MRATKLTEKDLSVMREADVAKVQREKKRGVLRDYSLKHRVVVEWDLNPEADKDQMFSLKIDDYTVILDAEELMRLLRWV